MEIDISIATSRIKDLENQKKMCEDSIMEILTEKREKDKSNLELEFQIQGRGVTSQDEKDKFEVAQAKKEMELEHQLQDNQDRANILLNQLKEEEKKSKDMLDLKITAEQTLEITEEDHKQMKARRIANKEDIIKHQLKLS